MISEATKKAIRDDAGPVKDLAKKYGVSTQSVRTIQGKKTYRRYDPEQIKELALSGVPVKEISEQTGASTQIIYRLLQNEGIKTRKIKAPPKVLPVTDEDIQQNIEDLAGLARARGYKSKTVMLDTLGLPSNDRLLRNGISWARALHCAGFECKIEKNEIRLKHLTTGKSQDIQPLILLYGKDFFMSDPVGWMKKYAEQLKGRFV